jgi:hypothetical protein
VKGQECGKSWSERSGKKGERKKVGEIIIIIII